MTLLLYTLAVLGSAWALHARWRPDGARRTLRPIPIRALPRPTPIRRPGR